MTISHFLFRILTDTALVYSGLLRKKLPSISFMYT